MTMIKALEKVLAEAPEGMKVNVTMCEVRTNTVFWWRPSRGAETLPLEDVVKALRNRERTTTIEYSSPTRDDNRWKVGQRIPNIDLPGYEQHVYRLLNDPEVIYVYVDPMTPAEMAEKAKRKLQEEKIGAALSKQPEEPGKSAYWWKWKI